MCPITMIKFLNIDCSIVVFKHIKCLNTTACFDRSLITCIILELSCIVLIQFTFWFPCITFICHSWSKVKKTSNHHGVCVCVWVCACVRACVCMWWSMWCMCSCVCMCACVCILLHKRMFPVTYNSEKFTYMESDIFRWMVQVPFFSSWSWPSFSMDIVGNHCDCCISWRWPKFLKVKLYKWLFLQVKAG